MGSADGDAGSDVVTGAVGRTALVASDTMLLSSEVSGAKGSLKVGEGSSELVTIPVGASKIALVVVGTSDASEVNRPGVVGSTVGLAGSDEVVRFTGASAVGEVASGVEESVVVGWTILAGTPPVEPTAGSVTATSGEMVGVGSVVGGTMRVLSTMTVVISAAGPVPVPVSAPAASVVSGELELTKVGLSVKLADRSVRSVKVSLFVVSGVPNRVD